MHKTERKGRNPATGEDLMQPARKVVTFKCSGKLKLHRLRGTQKKKLDLAKNLDQAF